MKEAVYDALIRNDITVVTFKWVKYVSDWYIPYGPSTMKGVWPSN